MAQIKFDQYTWLSVSDILKLIRLYLVCLALFQGKGPDHTCSVSFVKVIAKELSCSVGNGYVESRCQEATEPSCRAVALSSSYSHSCIKELVIGNNCDPLRETQHILHKLIFC